MEVSGSTGEGNCPRSIGSIGTRSEDSIGCEVFVVVESRCAGLDDCISTYIYY